MIQEEFALQEMEVHYTPRWDKPSEEKITSSTIAFKLLFGIFNKVSIACQEECIVLFLNQANMPLGVLKLSRGGISGTVVDIRIILATALTSLASSIIIAHNHPSGQLKPSKSDEELTNKLKHGAKLLDITLLDHLIITPDNKYYSFSDEGNL